MSISQDLKWDLKPKYIYSLKTTRKSPLFLSDFQKSPLKFKKQRTSDSDDISALLTHARELTRSIASTINPPSNKLLSDVTSANLGIFNDPPQSHLTLALNNHESSHFNISSNNSNDRNTPSNNPSADLGFFKEPLELHLTLALNNHNSSSSNKPSNNFYDRNPPQNTQHNQAQPKFPTPHKRYLDSGTTHDVIPDLNLPYLDFGSTHHVIPDINHSSYMPYQGYEQLCTEMQIFVKNINGMTFTFEVKQTDKVEALKAKIYDKSGIKLDYQKLIFGGKQLEDGTIIVDYGIKKASIIHLVVRFHGA